MRVVLVSFFVGLLGLACGSSETKAPLDGGPVGGAADGVGLADGASASDAAASTADAQSADPYAALTANGPWQVGHRIVSLTYTLPAGLGERTIPLHLWYPTTATSGEHPAYLGLFADPEAWTDGPLATAAVPPKGLPVLLYSHGYKGFAGSSHNTMRLVASHGWLAAAPEHVGNTLADTPDKLPLQVSLERALDIRATLDWLTKPPAADALAGKVDIDHVALSGHSFGTWTTWAVAGATISSKALQEGCAKGKWPDCSAALLAQMQQPLGDARVKTILALAGDGSPLVHDHGIDAVKIPVLQMNGSLDNAGQAELYAAATAVDLTWVKVEGGCHQLYGLGNTVIGSKECAVLPDAQGFALVRPWILAWLRNKVLGDTDPLVVQLVTGKVLNSPMVTFQHKGP